MGGLREVRQQLMDTILLPAKVSVHVANLKIIRCVFSQMEEGLYQKGRTEDIKLNKVNVMTMHLSFVALYPFNIMTAV